MTENSDVLTYTFFDRFVRRVIVIPGSWISRLFDQLHHVHVIYVVVHEIRLKCMGVGDICNALLHAQRDSMHGAY